MKVVAAMSGGVDSAVAAARAIVQSNDLNILFAPLMTAYGLAFAEVRTMDLGLLYRALTDRQQEIWNFLVEYVDGHGYPPTVREIGEAWRPHRGAAAIFTWHCYNNPAL